VISEKTIGGHAIQGRGVGVGNKYVKWSGVSVAVGGTLLAIVGRTLWAYQTVVWDGLHYVARTPHEDLGRTVWYIGLVVIVTGVVLLVAGFVLKPSIREVKQARRLFEENLMRLQEYEKEKGV
jgi:hypothetical protein